MLFCLEANNWKSKEMVHEKLQQVSRFVRTLRAGERNSRHLSPTAASLFLNIFRNNRAHILILLSFASGSGADLKTTCKVCTPDYFCLSSKELFYIYLRYFRKGHLKKRLMSHLSSFVPVPSQLAAHCFASQKGLWENKFRSRSKKWKTVVLCKTAESTVKLMTRPLHNVCLLLCGRCSLPLHRFLNIVCCFCLLLCALSWC